MVFLIENLHVPAYNMGSLKEVMPANNMGSLGKVISPCTYLRKGTNRIHYGVPGNLGMVEISIQYRVLRRGYISIQYGQQER